MFRSTATIKRVLSQSYALVVQTITLSRPPDKGRNVQGLVILPSALVALAVRAVDGSPTSYATAPARAIYSRHLKVGYDCGVGRNVGSNPTESVNQTLDSGFQDRTGYLKVSLSYPIDIIISSISFVYTYKIS